MITEMIFLDRDNENELLVELDGAAADFSGVIRMTLAFEGSGVMIDSAINPELISWTADGHISLRLGALAIEPSKYFGTLVAFDPIHDDGQVIFHAAEARVEFWFVPA